MKTLLVETREQLQRVVDRYLERGKPIFADTETTGLNHRTNKLVAVQMLQQGAEAVVIIDCRKLTDISQLNRLSGLRWVFHNASFDWQFLVANGVELRCLYDSLIAEQVILSASSGPSLKEVVEKYAGVTLDKDGREWFYEPTPLDQRSVEVLVGGTFDDPIYESRWAWYEPFPTEQIEYMQNDVIYLDAVCTGQGNALRASGQGKVAMLEMRVIPAIARMEMNGVYVDVDAWREVINEQAAEGELLYDELLASDLAQAILKLRAKELDAQVAAKEAHKAAVKEQEAYLREVWDSVEDGYGVRGAWDGWGEFKKEGMQTWREEHPAPPAPNKALREVNLGSHQQLKAGLDALGVRVKSTEADELEKASARYPVLKPLLAWRKTEKFVSTYGETLLERMGEDGRMHPRFNQIGAETGRMSSSKPNWQNIPARTEVGKRLRQCVVAPPGKMLLVGDFSIIELRILADMSGDETMMEMFASGMDLHTFTARKMFKLPDSMTDEDVKNHRLPNGLKARDVSKTTNYGVVYGQTEWGFSRKFGTDVETARGFIEQWFTSYRRAGEYLKELADIALRNGYSTTALGRRRYYTLPIAPDGDDPNFEERWRQYDREQEAIRRAGMNHPVQGTCADIVKLAVAMWNEATTRHDASKLVAVVHDELVVETNECDAQLEKDRLEVTMLFAAKSVLKRVDVPMPDVNIGRAWEH